MKYQELMKKYYGEVCNLSELLQYGQFISIAYCWGSRIK